MPKIAHQYGREEIRQNLQRVSDEMEPAGTSSINKPDIRMARALRYIMHEDTADFKDFYHPSNAHIVLYYCQHEKILCHLKKMKANDLHGYFMGIVNLYRDYYSKKDDIQFLMTLFRDLEQLYLKVVNFKIEVQYMVTKLQRFDAEAETELKEFRKLNRMMPALEIAMPLSEVAIGNDAVAPSDQEIGSKAKRHNSVRHVQRSRCPET